MRAAQPDAPHGAFYMRHINTGRFDTALRALAMGLGVSLSLALGACGGGGGSDLSTPAAGTPTTPTAPTYTIGGTVSGLTAGQTVALQNNGGGTLSVNANGAFTFAAAQQSNTAYSVSVSTEPSARTTCTVSNGAGTVGTGNVTNVGVSCVTQHFAYVTNINNNKVSLCSVDATTGALSGCASTASGFSTPYGIALSPNGSYAYVESYGGNTVSQCSVNAATGALTNCASTGSGFSGPLGAALSANGSYAYVVNYTSSTVSQCNVSATTGALSHCTRTGSAFSRPDGVALSANGSYAYVTNQGSNTVTQCSVNATTGVLTNCASTGSAF